MKRKTIFSIVVLLGFAVVAYSVPFGDLNLRKEGARVIVGGAHFELVFDCGRGGEMTGLRLWDGSQWNEVLGSENATYPRLKLADREAEYFLVHDRSARLKNLKREKGRIGFEVEGVPKTVEGKSSPWSIRVRYDIYGEGAVFAEVEYDLRAGEFLLADSSIAFPVNERILAAAKCRFADRTLNYGQGMPWAFRSARLAFGVNPERSFTNEIEVIVQEKKAMVGAVDERQEKGKYVWVLGGGDARLSAPYQYRNLLAMGLGAAAVGRPKSTMVGQRVFHWVNELDKRPERWYPTDRQIDKMRENFGTTLILHQHWMGQGGSNGFPHADYRTPRDGEGLRRTVARTHKNGMRAAVYMRGIEDYGLRARFFETYLKRDRDGIYVDWHGAYCRSYHEHKYRPDAALGDTHFSADGSYLPVKEYFLFTRKLRSIVGPGGFLIGHQGGLNSGILGNIGFDAYLPGEAGSDHDMFARQDEAVYKGMMAAGVSMPWTLDAPAFRTPEAVAKMAVWGFYTHIVMGDRGSLSLEANDGSYAYILPYWRILSVVDAAKAQEFHSPAQNANAVVSSNPEFHSIVYKDGNRGYLLITANLGADEGSARLKLETRLLGMIGSYRLWRVDPRTGIREPAGSSSGEVDTGNRKQWEIAGFYFSK